MKQQNVPENDPEYLKAHRFLTAVQQQQNFRKLALAQEPSVGLRQRIIPSHQTNSIHCEPKSMLSRCFRRTYLFLPNCKSNCLVLSRNSLSQLLTLWL